MEPRTRATCVLLLLAGGFTIISLHLVQIQLVEHAKFWRMAIENHLHPETIPPRRGGIFDSDGNVLAETQELYDLRLDGLKMRASHPEVALPEIARILQVTPGQIAQLYNPKNRYQLLAQNLDDGMVTRLRALNLDSLIFEPNDRRSYPNNELAAHILGYVDETGHGVAGMEKEMDSLLCGSPGERWVERDAKHREIAGYQTREKPAVDGCDVTLTVNMTIQHVIEDELDQIVQNYQPHAAYIIVMDPHTGEILAMASRPTFDPNDHRTFEHERVDNRCITDMVEPGSIFKIITLSAALNEHAVTLDTPVFCENGSYYYGGKILKDDEPHGTLPVEEVLSQSSNIGFAKIALNDLGEDKLYKYARAFGIGQRTGIFEGQAESSGLLRPVTKWSALSITRIPMGQEVAATPLQMVDAMCVVANGGKLMAPYLASKVADSTGQVIHTFKPRVIRQVISPAVAADVAKALHQVTIDGTAKDIKIPGYSYGGKTGTAQKFVDGAYSHTQFVSSFIGFLPAQDPSFVALVMVDDPHTKKYYGAEVSAPVFADMARQVAQILNIPEDQPETFTPAPALSSTNPSSL
jgi:cell division protein FtsI (penicillin-binding protein 3)/stage V sporulation protein D (sporulation-specific penicillin-binding protein)